MSTDNSLPTVSPFIYVVSWSAVWLFYRLSGWKVHGKENVPRHGAVILASNHVSMMDPPAVNFALSRVPRTMAKSELFKGHGGWLMRGLGAFPVRRGTADRAAIKRALKVLEAGLILSVFPEGTRSVDGNLKEAEAGFSYIVHAAKVPVIPVYNQGNEKTLSPQHSGFRLARNEIWFGPALRFDEEWKQKANRGMLDSIGKRVMTAIGELQKQASGRR